jgi:hypothetical protein
LRRCLADGSGNAATVPPEVRREALMGKHTVTLVETWRKACYDGRIAGSVKQDAAQKAFKRAANALQAARIVAIHLDYVWLPSEPHHAPDVDH